MANPGPIIEQGQGTHPIFEKVEEDFFLYPMHIFFVPEV